MSAFIRLHAVGGVVLLGLGLSFFQALKRSFVGVKPTFS